jgi:hypothetical protein
MYFVSREMVTLNWTSALPSAFSLFLRLKMNFCCHVVVLSWYNTKEQQKRIVMTFILYRSKVEKQLKGLEE